MVTTATPLDADAVRAALREIDDPEVGINIVDLGLVYGVDTAGGGIAIRLTMTTPSCPLGSFIADEVRRLLQQRFAAAVAVELVWDPPWRAEMMSDAARRQLGR
jgi:metal-sulfur cluster biosynthetic enzyme